MQAQKEGVELFRVLPNVTLEEIARILPQTSAEFMAIKGIKEGRFKKYGAMLLAMMRDVDVLNQNEIRANKAAPVKQFSIVNDDDYLFESIPEEIQSGEVMDEEVSDIPGQRTLYTVSDFLEALNVLFAEMTVRVKGEISSVDIRDKAIYFTLKDSVDASILSCLIFRYQYDISGVKLEVGQEVIVEGVPGIWKPTGRLSLKASSLEVSGEGALQKAYNDLKQKLEKEGLFDVSTKRALPEFPQRIALITSSQGAAIGDFLMNLGKCGFKISLFDASVEGQRAVFDLLKAVEFFNQHAEDYDVLVIIRGGGSLESLQAFNNESLVRAVAQSTIPTLCGIGHEKDVSLVALAGDVMVSTPTATARALRESFVQANTSILRYEQKIIGGFESMLQVTERQCNDRSQFLLRQLQFIKDGALRVQNMFLRSVEKLQFSIHTKQTHIEQMQIILKNTYTSQLQSMCEKIQQQESRLAMHDPRRLLRLGYSLVMSKGTLIRSVGDVKKGDTLSVQVADGVIDTVVES